jgi:hypothetical protein
MKILAFSLLSLLVVPGLCGQGIVPSENQRKVDLPLDQWLSAGPHRDFKARSKIQKPRLTFQQRYLVRLVTTIDMRALQKNGVERDLHHVIKVADESGRWFPEETYSHSTFNASLHNTDLQIVTDLYMLPGRYNVATIIYDSVQQIRDVLMKTVQVPQVKDDPLPDLAHHLSRVEFLPPSQRGRYQLGHGTAWLPVSTKNAVQIELLVDAGNAYSASEDILAANIVSQIRPSRGCVYVSVLDTLRQEIMFLHEEAQQLDWEKRGQQVLDRDLNTIDVAHLNERNTGAFFRDRVQKLLEEKPACPGMAQTPRRVFVVLTSGLGFVGGTIPKLEISPESVISTIHLRVGYIFFDNAQKVLRPLAPRTKTAGNPVSFRREVKHIMDEIWQAGQ